MAILKASHVMLGRLEAEESLLAVRRVALGSGAVADEQSARRSMQRFIDAAYPDQRPVRAAKPTIAELEAMGIKVHKVPKVKPT